MIWILCVALAVLTTLLVLKPLAKPLPQDVSEHEPADVAFYKAQLAEIDRDVAAGRLSKDEAERAHAEVARRLLRASASAQSTTASRAPNFAVWAAFGGALLFGGGLLLYSQFGAPKYAVSVPHQARIEAAEDLRAARPSQAEMEIETERATPSFAPPERDAELIAKLRAVVAENPDELQGWEYLRNFEISLANYTSARLAQENIVRIQGDSVTEEDETYLLALMVSAAGGRVSPEAELLARRLLRENEENAAARYFIGLMYAQTDRPDIAFRAWRPIAEQGDPQDPYTQFARDGMPRVAFDAGRDYELPPQRGPSAADIAAADDMSEQDRAAMIEGMVAQLSDRLAREGGPAADWAQLIRAYGVMGNTEQAGAIYTEALSVFAGDEAGLAQITAAGEVAGVAQ